MDTEATAVRVLALLGIVSFIPLLYRFVNFIWIYFLRPSSIHNYLHVSKPYALVTGASDGIGKAVAKQLYLKGFNLILHGRNEEKVKRVVEEIKSLDPTSKRDIQYFLADATKEGHDFQKLLSPFRDLNITLIVNNVGGGPVGSRRLDEWASEEILEIIRCNTLFPLQLIHALLPQLRKVASAVLVLNIGSMAGDVPPPRLPLYSSSKRFMETLSWALSVDERYYTATNVDFIYVSVGEVCTNAVRKERNLFRPGSDAFARALVHRIGCSGRRITPYLTHAIAQWFASVFGDYVAESMTAAAMWQLYHGKKQD